jgi:hypothetical protein
MTVKTRKSGKKSRRRRGGQGGGDRYSESLDTRAANIKTNRESGQRAEAVRKEAARTAAAMEAAMAVEAKRWENLSVWEKMKEHGDSVTNAATDAMGTVTNAATDAQQKATAMIGVGGRKSRQRGGTTGCCQSMSPSSLLARVEGSGNYGPSHARAVAGGWLGNQGGPISGGRKSRRSGRKSRRRGTKKGMRRKTARRAYKHKRRH